MDSELPIPEYLFPIAFPAFWCLILFFLANSSGWRRVAKTFSFEGIIDGEYYRFQSANVSGVSFGGALEMGVNDVGLILVPFLPFRPFHKKLLIPWEYLRAEKYDRFLFSGYKIILTKDERFYLTISEKQFSRMKDRICMKEELANQSAHTTPASAPR
ncbi:hypothetical protein [Pelagicoccus sp. SDUM812003]|uniref:hypothetical protein n=1 Tax=Pelagicoccus sp. SDUM812003 TaxID=3041267 RepID=UPI00280CDF0F|nr:hypothetical protein [Pelagicoccus sp. SDUM812003]MDQ8205749.1 hypothetical protein [Pelagicoccus sp. SDUM812003]